MWPLSPTPSPSIALTLSWLHPFVLLCYLFCWVPPDLGILPQTPIIEITMHPRLYPMKSHLPGSPYCILNGHSFAPTSFLILSQFTENRAWLLQLSYDGQDIFVFIMWLFLVTDTQGKSKAFGYPQAWTWAAAGNCLEDQHQSVFVYFKILLL